MKKIMTLSVAVVMVAGVAVADLAVDWQQTTAAVYDVGGAGGGGPFVDNGMIQLIWSATGIQTTTPGQYNVAGGSLLPGEFQLDFGVTTGGFGNWVGLGGIYGNTDVGDAEINSGFFFTRIFQDASGSAGVFFLDTGEVDASAWVYDAGPPANPGTVYSANATGVVWIDQNATTTVIPEPATLGMMAVAGLGMFLARKKARR